MFDEVMEARRKVTFYLAQNTVKDMRKISLADLQKKYTGLVIQYQALGK